MVSAIYTIRIEATTSLLRGMIFSDLSEDSVWKSCIPPTFKNGKSIIAKATIPIPPIHWIIERQTKMPCDIVSNPESTVDPDAGGRADIDADTLGAYVTYTPGNGFYADFSMIISHTVDSPQPLLVGVAEGSPAGFGYVDYTRVPVSLYPAGPECPIP